MRQRVGVLQEIRVDDQMGASVLWMLYADWARDAERSPPGFQLSATETLMRFRHR